MDSSPENFTTAPSTPNPLTPTPSDVSCKKWKVKRQRKGKKEKKATPTENDAQDSSHNDTNVPDQNLPNDPLIPIHINNENITTIPLSTFVTHTSFQHPPVPFNLHRLTSPTAANHVLTWLAAQPTNPGPLPAPSPPITLKEACQRYAVAFALRVPRLTQGDALRDEIWLYMWSPPELTLEEMRMVLELLWFDKGLVKLALGRMKGRAGEGGEGGEEMMELVGEAERLLQEGGRREVR